MAAPRRSRSWYRPKKAYTSRRPRSADYDQLSEWIDLRAQAKARSTAERVAAIQARAAGDGDLMDAANDRADAHYAEYTRLDELIGKNMPPIRGRS